MSTQGGLNGMRDHIAKFLTNMKGGGFFRLCL